MWVLQKGVAVMVESFWEKKKRINGKKNQLLKMRPFLACAFYLLLERKVNDLMSPFSDGFPASIKTTYGRGKRQADLAGGGGEAT